MGDGVLAGNLRLADEIETDRFHRGVDLGLVNRLDEGGKVTAVQFVDDGVGNSQDVIARAAFLDVIFEERHAGRRSNDKEARPGPPAQLRVQILDETVVQHHPAAQTVIEHQHIVAAAVAVQRNPARLVRNILALEQAERVGAPALPGQFAQAGKIVKPGIVESEGFGLDGVPRVSDLFTQCQHSSLHSVYSKLS